MRLLPNVIKSAEYGNIVQTAAFSQAVCKNTVYPSVSPDEIKRHIVEDTMAQTQKMIESAQIFCETRIQETTQQMNEESAKIRIRSRDEGYQQGLKEGKTQGYEDGYEQGIKDACKKQQHLLDQMTLLLQDMEQQKDEILERFSNDIHKLSFAIAQKIVKTQLSINTESMTSIIASATEKYRGEEWLKIIVSKNTADQFAQEGNHILTTLCEVSNNIKIVASPDLQDSDCIIDMPDKVIDVSVDTQLQKIKSSLEI